MFKVSEYHVYRVNNVYKIKVNENCKLNKKKKKKKKEKKTKKKKTVSSSAVKVSVLARPMSRYTIRWVYK